MSSKKVLESLRKERTLLRSSLTRGRNKMQEIIDGEVDDDRKEQLKAHLEVSRQRFEELCGTDSAIRELLLQDENIEEQKLFEEQEGVDEYTTQYQVMKNKVEKLLLGEQNLENLTSQSVISDGGYSGSMKYKLPTLKLKEFNGTIGDWLPFWSQFSKIDQDASIHNVDKLGYLSMCMIPNSPAAKLVQSYPATGEMYSEVVNALKTRFGRTDLLTEYYIRQLLKIILQNNNVKQPLSVLYDTLQCHLRNLEALDVSVDNNAAILMPLVSSCLPDSILQIWERSCVTQLAATNPDATSKGHLKSLLRFIQAEVEGQQKLSMAKEGFGLHAATAIQRTKSPKSMSSNSTTNRIPTAAGLVNASASQGESRLCIFCSGNHSPQDCKKAVHMPLEKRQECVRKSNACYCCLKVGHRANRCRRRPKCTVCDRGHFALLCNSRTETCNSTGEVNSSTSCAASVNQCNVLMQTLLVNVEGPQGQTRKARVLIDTGSQKSYLLSSTAKEMNYSPVRTETIQHALFGGNVTNAVDHNVYTLHLSYNNYRCDFEVLDQVKICSTIPTVPRGPWIDELKKRNIEIEDTGPSGEIDILIGSDMAGRLYTGEVVILESQLVAMNTHLGWTLSGKVPGSTSEENLAMLVTSLLIKDSNITDLWSLDVLGISDPTQKALKSDIEKATMEHFLSTVRVDEDGRFEVRLPFVANHPPLSVNHDLAQKRLQSTLKRLEKDGYLNEYDKVLTGWEGSGIIEEVPPLDLNKSGFFLPHHHVLKLNSTTPIRPVYDASATEQGKVSLNQCLESGPNLIEKIPACLARFRMNQCAVSGDIKQAFLQISVCEKDRDFLRFLWKSPDGTLKQYRHCRVVFGVSSSPFLLEASIQFHLDDVIARVKNGVVDWPLPFVEKLKDSFYVDNCLTSLNNEFEAKEFIRIATAIMKERQFDLRGWEQTGEIAEKPTNVLGILWNKNEDTLSINIDKLIELDREQVVTKKVLLSVAHKLFDPIGIISPVTLIPKLLLQQTWCEDLSWKDEVSQDTRTQFLRWLDEISQLNEVKVQRWISYTENKDTQCELHIFADACKTSYAAAVFLRIQCQDKVSLCLLASKARVAPTSKSSKGITIPRLELLAALIAARLYDNVVKDYGLGGTHATFWTDASTVLAWLNRNEVWDAYVFNRVKEIRTLTEGHKWRHVPGEMNPADLPSRGCSAKKLVKSQWWKGPEWLRMSSENWPNSDFTYNEDEIGKEKRKIVVSSVVCSNKDTDDKDWYYRHFSQYKKIVRMIGWILRFRSNCLVRVEERTRGELTTDEYKTAEERLLLLVQNESFTGVNKNKLNNLMTFVDTNGLMRIKTKVSNLQDSMDFCNPIVLPSANHPLVDRLIMDMHCSNCHAGSQILQSILRQQFWILGGKKTIRSVLNKCVKCKRFMAKKLEVEPTPLPETRVRDTKVFEVTGVDLAGPLFIKGDDKSTKKVWVCLFTCAVYRAVRMELVSSLSTDSFLQAFKRFCSRHGRPKIVYSDNGTNFVGFVSASHKLDWNAISQYTTARKIEWRFNPPSSPWWGGWWERLIGILKGLLRRVLGRSSVSYEDMLTLLCDCEAVINSRPLTYLSDDSSDLAAITPAMFLFDLEEVGVPEYDLMTIDFKHRLKYRCDLKKQLRQRFKVEYLGQLRLFSCKKKEHTSNVGDIVLIGDDNTKRLDWPIGRIVELIPGKDDRVRVVRVRTSSGVLTRPVQRLYPLETIECSDVNLDCNDTDNLNDIEVAISAPENNQLPINSDPYCEMVQDIEQFSLNEVPDVTSDEPVESHTRSKPLRQSCDLLPKLTMTKRGRCIKKPSRFDL